MSYPPYFLHPWSVLVAVLCTQYNCSSQVRVYRIQYSTHLSTWTLKVLQSSANSFTNLLQYYNYENTEKWEHNEKITWMYLLELNVDTWNTKKMIKRPHFIFCSKWPWPANLVFCIISLFLGSCTKQSYLQQSIHQGRKKQGHCVQGDYKHFGNQTHFPIRSILFRSILYKG